MSGQWNANPCKVLFIAVYQCINVTLSKLSILFMHFYFRLSLLLYVYGLQRTHHSSCSRRAGFFTEGSDKVVMGTWESLIGMSIRFDGCWNESLSNLQQTFACFAGLSCGLLCGIGAPRFGFGTSDPGYPKTASALDLKYATTSDLLIAT